MAQGYKERRHRLLPNEMARGYYSWLHSILDAIFETSAGRHLSDKELAEIAGVAPRTVTLHRLKEIRCPYAVTVWKLARATGVTLKTGQDRSAGHEGRTRKRKSAVGKALATV